MNKEKAHYTHISPKMNPVKASLCKVRHSHAKKKATYTETQTNSVYVIRSSVKSEYFEINRA